MAENAETKCPIKARREPLLAGARVYREAAKTQQRERRLYGKALPMTYPSNAGEPGRLLGRQADSKTDTQNNVCYNFGAGVFGKLCTTNGRRGVVGTLCGNRISRVVDRTEHVHCAHSFFMSAACTRPRCIFPTEHTQRGGTRAC